MLNIQYLRELCEKATKEPWTADVDEPDDCVVWSGTGKSAEFIGNIGDVVTPIIQDTEKARVIFDVEINNCKFIAASREALPELLDRVEALEWLLEVQEITWADMDAMSMEGFREFREIRKKALRDAGREGCDMIGISGPEVYSCPWCGRSVEQGESCWCKQSQEEAMTRQEIRAALKGARADNVRLEAENVRLASMLGEEAKRRKEADAENARLLEAGNNLRSFAVPGMDWTDEIARAALDGWDALKPAGGE